eukprot:652925-Lingulodinium_polyedra.AAC.1
MATVHKTRPSHTHARACDPPWIARWCNATSRTNTETILAATASPSLCSPCPMHGSPFHSPAR